MKSEFDGEKTVCGKCGQEIKNMWPFCPHPRLASGSSFTNIRDEIPGGIVLENYGPTPIKVYSHSERRQIMKERGLREMGRHAPLPGTDKDPQGIVKWDSCMDAQTLENARILVSRPGARCEPEPEDSTVGITNFFNVVADPESIREIQEIVDGK